MKTITEFDGFFLKRVIDKNTALIAESKTPEEIQTALGEEFKAEGDKLKFLMTAIEIGKAKILGLKRVLVSTFAEGEKVPSGYTEKEGHYFSLEHFPQPPKPASHSRNDGRPDRGGKRGGKDGKKGKPRGKGDGRRDDNRGEGRGEARVDGRDRNRAPAPANAAAPRPNVRPISVKPAAPASAAPAIKPAAKVSITFTDGKPKIQTASSNPSPETPSLSPTPSPTESTPETSQS